jgi:DNA gyrase subunit A
MVVSDGGTIIRLPVGDVRVYSRQARGVRIIALGKDEKVVSIHPVDAADESEDALEVDGSAGSVFATDGDEDFGADDDAGADATDDFTPDDDDAS